MGRNVINLFHSLTSIKRKSGCHLSAIIVPCYFMIVWLWRYRSWRGRPLCGAITIQGLLWPVSTRELRIKPRHIYFQSETWINLIPNEQEGHCEPSMDYYNVERTFKWDDLFPVLPLQKISFNFPFWPHQKQLSELCFWFVTFETGAK